MATQTKEQEAPAPKAKRWFQFPTAVTTLVIVTLLVWVAAGRAGHRRRPDLPDPGPVAGDPGRDPGRDR
jgi:hypothetical protein